MAEENLRRFHEGFRERRVRVHTFREVADRCAHFHCDDAFTDEFARTVAHNAHTENTFGFRINNQLRQTIRTVKRECATRSAPWKSGDLDLRSFGASFSFRQAAPGDFRIGEDNRWNYN